MMLVVFRNESSEKRYEATRIGLTQMLKDAHIQDDSTEELSSPLSDGISDEIIDK